MCKEEEPVRDKPACMQISAFHSNSILPNPKNEKPTAFLLPLAQSFSQDSHRRRWPGRPATRHQPSRPRQTEIFAQEARQGKTARTNEILWRKWTEIVSSTTLSARHVDGRKSVARSSSSANERKFLVRRGLGRGQRNLMPISTTQTRDSSGNELDWTGTAEGDSVAPVLSTSIHLTQLHS